MEQPRFMLIADDSDGLRRSEAGLKVRGGVGGYLLRIGEPGEEAFDAAGFIVIAQRGKRTGTLEEEAVQVKGADFADVAGAEGTDEEVKAGELGVTGRGFEARA